MMMSPQWTMSDGYNGLISQNAAQKAKTRDRGATELHHRTILKMPEDSSNF